MAKRSRGRGATIAAFVLCVAMNVAPIPALVAAAEPSPERRTAAPAVIHPCNTAWGTVSGKHESRGSSIAIHVPFAEGVVTTPGGAGSFYSDGGHVDFSGLYQGFASDYFAIDLSAPAGQPVAAAADGTVRTVANLGTSGYGRFIVLSHPGGLSTVYAHLTDQTVVEGAQVRAGQTIGHVGSTGNSTGAHLHFGLHDGAISIRPEPLDGQTPCDGVSLTSHNTLVQTLVSVQITAEPAVNRWYSADISVSWHVDWGSCGSGTWSQEWDREPTGPRYSVADGFTRFSYMGPSWPDGMHTHYVRWWACGASGLVSMGPYGADRTPPSIAALSFDGNGHASGSTFWGPITIHGGMTDGSSGPASLRLDVLHDGQWEQGRGGILNAANNWTSTFDPAGIAPQDLRVHGWGADNVGNSTNNFGALWLTLVSGPPAAARPAFYSAAYEALVVPSTMQVGTQAQATIGITNTSASAWPNGATGVRASYHWHGPTEVWDGVRGDIPALGPGERVQLIIRIDPPPTAGTYTLDLDLVYETVTWFSWQGVPPRSSTVTVTAGAAPPGAAPPGPAPVAPVEPGGVRLQPRPAPLQPAPFAIPPAGAYHAAWAAQGAYPTVAPGALFEWTVAFRNTGSAGWYRGFAGAHANIGTAGPLDSDYATRLGMDPGNWQAPNRIASQTTDYVGPGQVAWFTVQFRAPATPGAYSIPIRPVIDGATWLEDYGVFLVVFVSN